MIPSARSARGDCGFPPPVADEGNPQSPQRSKNRRISVSPNGFSGPARWENPSFCAIKETSFVYQGKRGFLVLTFTDFAAVT